MSVRLLAFRSALFTLPFRAMGCGGMPYDDDRGIIRMHECTYVGIRSGIHACMYEYAWGSLL